MTNRKKTAPTKKTEKIVHIEINLDEAEKLRRDQEEQEARHRQQENQKTKERVREHFASMADPTLTPKEQAMCRAIGKEVATGNRSARLVTEYLRQPEQENKRPLILASSIKLPPIKGFNFSKPPTDHIEGRTDEKKDITEAASKQKPSSKLSEQSKDVHTFGKRWKASLDFRLVWDIRNPRKPIKYVPTDTQRKVFNYVFDKLVGDKKEVSAVKKEAVHKAVSGSLSEKANLKRDLFSVYTSYRNLYDLAFEELDRTSIRFNYGDI